MQSFFLLHVNGEHTTGKTDLKEICLHLSSLPHSKEGHMN